MKKHKHWRLDGSLRPVIYNRECQDLRVLDQIGDL